MASKWANIEEASIPVPTDGVVLHSPNGGKKPTIILNQNFSSAQGRRRFTVAHEIGHLTIAWHGGSIVCHVDEDTVSVDSEHHTYEAQANRFASELLMPTEWVERVYSEELMIESTFNRLVSEADVSVSAAKIKLMKILPPGYVCMEYNKYTSQVLRMDCSRGTGLELYLKFSENRDFDTIVNKLENHASDGCIVRRGVHNLRFWRLECRESLPEISDSRNSADILRNLVQDVFPDRDWDFHTQAIRSINGYASAANQIASNRDPETIFGTMVSRFSQERVAESKFVRAVSKHSDFQIYMAIKSREMASGNKVKGARKKSFFEWLLSCYRAGYRVSRLRPVGVIKG